MYIQNKYVLQSYNYMYCKYYLNIGVTLDDE